MVYQRPQSSAASSTRVAGSASARRTTRVYYESDLRARVRKRILDKERRQLSKEFGHIADVPVFTTWASRQECSEAAVHRPIQGGIHGTRKDGTYSVILTGEYADDEDLGDTIIYTGTGDGKKESNKSTKLWTSNQSWGAGPNQSLFKSQQTGKPVRVVRSSKLGSKYAPLRPFRYDGLYKVVKCWTDEGKGGNDICRCELMRLPGQPPIPVRQ